MTLLDLDLLRDELAHSGERRLLVIAGPAGWCRHHGAALVHAWGGRWGWASTSAKRAAAGEKGAAQNASMAKRGSATPAANDMLPGPSDAVPTGATLLSARQPDAALGSEWDGVVLDAWSGLRPDLLGAVGGAVRGGGLLVLLAPPLFQWSGWHDPDYGRMAAFPLQPADLGQRWWRRLHGLLDHPAVLVWDERSSVRLPRGEAPPLWSPAATALAEQQAVVAAMARCATGRAHRPLVLVADRGRGKSAALGMAAAQLAAQGRPLLVTAPRVSACAALFRHAQGVNGGTATPPSLVSVAESFVPFAELRQALLQRRIDPATLLLVDEAAGLPVAGLAQLARHPRVVFASTVHGYEGNGRGFELRFLPRLAAIAPHWRRAALTAPLRWVDGDPLETWLAAALLLDAEPAQTPTVRPELAFPALDKCAPTRDGSAAFTAGAEEVPAARRSPDAIAEQPDPLTLQPLAADDLGDESLLRQLFGLLVQAHYRTAPDDLRQLLDDPTLRLWVARVDGAVVGVLVAAAEGPLPPELHADIVANRRRPRGHLLPQSLAAHAGAGWALSRRWWRVVRIAVAPAWQRRRIGRQLLAALERAAVAEGCEVLGVSFAADAAVLRFWQAAGFRLLRIGVEREPSSGGEALLLGRPLTAGVAAEMDGLAARLQRQLPLLLADRLRDWEPALVAAALRRADPLATCSGAVDPGRPAELDDGDLAEARRFAAGAVGLAHALDAVARVARAALAAGALPVEPGATLLVGRALQLRGWEELVRMTALPGRAAAEEALRGTVAALLPQVDSGRPGR